ncbi:SHOCT domain-containing protein [Halorarius halobius]|uniref:SHOCT domain-containing protein n=1 Tax=Halorarius halobius TaxID=2962671 RepID=UPI0020CE8067|nr:SHOCT domain-containing protein [Halorarius halobius]
MSDSDDLLRIALVVLGVLLFAPLLVMGLMMPMMGYWYTGGGMGPGMMGSGGGLWWVGTLLLPLVVLGVGGYALYRLLTGRDGGGDPAVRELRMAYARGDLSDEEFDERRERLGE